MKQRQKNKILVLGGYTHANRGDHAMQLGLVNWIIKNQPSAELVFYTENPDVTSKMIPVRCIWSPDIYFLSEWNQANKHVPLLSVIGRIMLLTKGTWFLFNFLLYKNIGVSLIRAKHVLGFYTQVLDAKAVFVVGSGSMNSFSWLSWVYPKAFCLCLAKITNVPIFLTSQGVGPFNNFLDKIVARYVFKFADFIGVRDGAKSKSVLKELGIAEEACFHTGDDAFLLQKANPLTVRKIMANENIPGDRRLIGVNLRDASSYSSEHAKPDRKKYAQLLDAFIASGNYHIVFIPISYDSWDDDRQSAQQLVNEITLKNNVTLVCNEYSATELRGLIGNMDACVGTSYHFLLFSLSNNVPAIGLYENSYYKQKQEGLFSLYGMLRYCIDFRNTEFSVALDLLKELILNRERIRMELRLVNGLLEQKTKQTRNLLIARLNNRSRRE